MNEEELTQKIIESVTRSGLLGSVQIQLTDVVWKLVVVFSLTYAVAIFYSRFSRTISDRQSFARNFVLIGMTTMLIISIVKSSLALSLGLVGALSIVRFRAAIKEPEELAYLFFVIAIGLGIGADQVAVTSLASLLILVGVFIQKYSRTSIHTASLHHLSVSYPKAIAISLAKVSDLLSEIGLNPQVKRFDETADLQEILFVVEIKDVDTLQLTRERLNDLSDGVAIRVIDSKPII
jgi:hypothetical protein